MSTKKTIKFVVIFLAVGLFIFWLGTQAGRKGGVQEVSMKGELKGETGTKQRKIKPLWIPTIFRTNPANPPWVWISYLFTRTKRKEPTRTS